ncbi:MAG: hypothetical protein ACKJSG_00560 [Lentisphaeria bacterium]
MDSAIEETYNIMIGGRAYRAIRELAEGLDEEELTASETSSKAASRSMSNKPNRTGYQWDSRPRDTFPES